LISALGNINDQSQQQNLYNSGILNASSLSTKRRKQEINHYCKEAQLLNQSMSGLRKPVETHGQSEGVKYIVV
jgi:hypothetical protein